MGKLITKKVIMIDPVSRDELAARYAVTKKSVLDALAFKSNSFKAQNIRKDALDEFGAKEVNKPLYVIS